MQIRESALKQLLIWQKGVITIRMINTRSKQIKKKYEIFNKGATVILACRDLNKARAACDKIKLETKSDLVFVEKLDLASLESIRDFAKNYQSKFSRLDILINNAGFIFQDYYLIIFSLI